MVVSQAVSAARVMGWVGCAELGGAGEQRRDDHLLHGHAVAGVIGCAGLTLSGSPATASTNITGVATGTSYTFTVTATNSAGTSSPSSASNAVVPASAANTSSAPTATANSARSVALSWAAPASNGATITVCTVTLSPA